MRFISLDIFSFRRFSNLFSVKLWIEVLEPMSTHIFFFLSLFLKFIRLLACSLWLIVGLLSCVSIHNVYIFCSPRIDNCGFLPFYEQKVFTDSIQGLLIHSFTIQCANLFDMKKKLCSVFPTKFIIDVYQQKCRSCFNVWFN